MELNEYGFNNEVCGFHQKNFRDIIDEINGKIDEIFQELNIKKTTDQTLKAIYAFRAFKYIVQNTKYDMMIGNERYYEQDVLNRTGRQIVAYDIYRCLIQNRAVCSGFALALSEMFKRIGIPHRAACLSVKEDGTQHIILIAMIDGKECYCDPTRINELYQMVGEGAIRSEFMKSSRDLYFNALTKGIYQFDSFMESFDLTEDELNVRASDKFVSNIDFDL